MKTLRLKSLELANFMGLRSFRCEPDGGDMAISAPNGCGKTTIGNAVTWLLFGKSLSGVEDFGIKTIGPDGQEMHNLDHTVNAVFDVDGRTLTLDRTYVEVWQAQRGAASKTWTGHTTNYKVDGVPKSESEYKRFIDALCPEAQFRLLSDPAWFPALDWKKRRGMLIDMVGATSDAEIITNTPSLAPLRGLLDGRSVDDYKAILLAERKLNTAERESLPARIDEASRAIIPTDGTDYQAILDSCNKRLSEWSNRRASLAAGGIVAEHRADIAALRAEQSEIESRLRNAPNPERSAALRAQADLIDKCSVAEHAIAAMAASIDDKDRRRVRLSTERERMIAEYRAEEARVCPAKVDLAAAEAMRAEVSDTCPSCKQALPPESVESAVAAFNASRAATIKRAQAAITTWESAKAERLAANKTQGRAIRAELDALSVEIEALQTTHAAALAELDRLRESAKAIVVPADAPSEPSSDPQWAANAERILALTAQLADAESQTQAEIAGIDQHIEEVRAQIADAQAKIAQADLSCKASERVAALTQDQRALAAQAEEIEHALYLIEQFVRTKVRLLTDAINSKFRLCSFRLFEELQNGGVKECCDILWRETMAAPSAGQAIQIGLDVIATLSAHVGFSPPVVIDGAESVTEWPQTPGQQIRLIVREGERKLHLERLTMSAAPMGLDDAPELALVGGDTPALTALELGY